MFVVKGVQCTAHTHPENLVWGYELKGPGKRDDIFGLPNRYNSCRIRCDSCGRLMKPQYLYGAIQYCDECYTEWCNVPWDLVDVEPIGIDYGDGLGYRLK
jgi:hypothetical protein